ncbi:MAG: hypothetical protein HOV81_14235 [Kofleriaceae bacterium]|nr:hypothetical protein [Kofleriaceae bacterium]
MGKKRPERTERRARERAVRDLVRDREKLAKLSPGGAAERPITVPSSAVIEVRIHGMTCPQCEGRYKIVDHRSAGQGMRPVDVRCDRCGTPRTLWFKIVEDLPN